MLSGDGNSVADTAGVGETVDGTVAQNPPVPDSAVPDSDAPDSGGTADDWHEKWLAAHPPKPARPPMSEKEIAEFYGETWDAAEPSDSNDGAQEIGSTPSEGEGAGTTDSGADCGPDSADDAGSAAGDSAVGGVGLSGGAVIEAPVLAGVVAAIEGQVELLGRIQTRGITNADLRALVVRMEAAQRSLFGYAHTWIADLMDQHGLDDIYGSVPEALSVLLRLSRARSNQRIRFAEQFGERTALTGERLEPVLPATTRASEDGVLDEEHLRVITTFFRSLRRKVDIETRENAERQLAQLARELLPDEFRVAARRLFDTLDPDGELKDEEQIANRCFLKLGDQGEDGLSKGSFVVDAELRAYLEAAFDKWAKPGMCNPADNTPATDTPDTSGEPGSDSNNDTDRTGTGTGNDTGDGSGESGGRSGESSGTSRDSHSSSSGGAGSDTRAQDPGLFDRPDTGTGSESGNASGSASNSGSRNGTDSGGSGSGVSADTDTDTDTDTDGDRDAVTEADARRRAERDHRSKGRRQHDALKVMLRQILASGQLGSHRGLPVTAVISMDLKDLESATGHAVTGTGSTIRMRDAIRMASHAHHYLVIFDDDGRPLHLGRTKRLASADQRIVLIAADKGCTHPGCTRPATWSQVHHIHEWTNGGNTDIDSLTFGCDIHHRLIGPRDTDWATTKAGPDHPYPGRTLWHPPITLDPLRRGKVNHYHHPNEYIYPTPDVPLPEQPLPEQPLPGMPAPGVDTAPGNHTQGDRPPGTPEPGTPEPGAPPA